MLYRAMDLDPYASMQVGMRVVRGVDWKWGNQDSGEGNVGTVVEIGRTGSPTTRIRLWSCSGIKATEPTIGLDFKELTTFFCMMTHK